jgi:5,10-methylenetetrahydromethanopterin reductase
MGMAPAEPLRKVAMVAKLAEDLGYSFFGNADQRGSGEKDAYVSLTTAALNTQKILVGPCISDPYWRHPALIARAVASIDDVSDGRAYLTLGAGGSEFDKLGIEKKNPNLALREAILIIKGMLTGEPVNFEGKMFKVKGHSLGFKPKSKIPIYLASRSPLNLQLAGELCDGAVIASYAAKENIGPALEFVKKGAAKVGRDLKEIDLVSWVYTSISKNREEAIENIKPFTIAALYNTAPEMYPKFGISVKAINFLMDARKRDLKGENLFAEASRVITHEDLQKFSVAGTADDCIKSVKSILQLGINTIWVRPFSAPGSMKEVEKVIRPFGEDVIPAFQ